MRLCAVITGLFFALASFPAGADSRTVLLELFTSQGCSSCPDADKMVGRLASRDEIIVLSLHVDYWDYIGWKDDFAKPAFTARQKNYARARGSRTVYTPQFIVNGREQIVGANPMDIDVALEKWEHVPQDVTLQLSRKGGRLEIEAQATGGAAGPLDIQLARYIPSRTVSIERGENAGKTITYYNIVTDLITLDRWNGSGRWSKSVGLQGDLPVVVFVQRAGPGEVLAAERLD